MKANERQARRVRLTCGCCGRWFLGEPDPDHDRGYGTCEDCMEWQLELFCRRPRELLLDNLSEENRRKFDAMSRERQQGVILRAFEDGIITWGAFE